MILPGSSVADIAQTFAELSDCADRVTKQRDCREADLRTVKPAAERLPPPPDQGPAARATARRAAPPGISSGLTMPAIVLASAETLGDVVVTGRSQCRDHLALVSLGTGQLASGGSAGSVQKGPRALMNMYLVSDRPALINTKRPIVAA